MVKLRKAAKLTQSRYGRRSQIAIGTKGVRPTISPTIESQRNGTSIKAQSGLRRLKNNGLHNMCSTRFTPKKRLIRSWAAESVAFVQARMPE
jgi:hypothetical protein